MPVNVANGNALNSGTEDCADATALFVGPGEVRSLARELDWSKSPLGPTTNWSPSLRTMARSMFDSPFPICLWSGPHYALVYNDAYRRILAAKHPAALGQPGSLVWAEIWEQLQPQFDGVRAGGAPIYFEDAPFVMARLEGGGTETAWFNYSLSALRDEDGSVAAILNISPETTGRILLERRLTEEQAALATSEAQFRTFAQAMPNQSWTARADGTLDWLNEQIFAYSGANEHELLGNDWVKIVHPDDLEAAAGHWAAALSSGETYETEFRIRRADGDYRWHLTRALPIKGDDGAIVRWIGTNTDIHEQKRIHAESAADRNRLWALSQDLMLVCDFEGVITAVNPSAYRMLGWTSDEMIGRSLGEFVHPDDLEITAAEREKLSQGVTSLAFENRYRTKQDGSYRLLAWTAVPDNGRIHAVGRDITAEAEAAAALAASEDALRQAQKMDAIGQLTGGVAHDFNNLLTVIRGSVDLLRRGNLAESRRQRYIEAIGEASDRAAKLTAQLLAFARRQALKSEVFNAGDSLAEVAFMVRTMTGSRIVLDIKVPEAAFFIDADRSQFDTAIVNMGINARDAMGGEGKLTIATGPVSGIPSLRGHPAKAGDFVAFTIADTGSGISPDILDRIFEPFFTTKNVGEGTGLGLSQVIGFAKQSGGDIRVDSVKGEGTTFTLYLPRAYPDGSEIVDLPMDDQTGGDGTCVLVVEDNEQVGAFATAALKEMGYDCVLSTNGREALRLLGENSERFHIVFSDVVMPGMSGIELGNEVRRLYPNLPIILTSGYSHVLAQNGQHGFELLHKPYSVEQLSRVLRKSTGWRTSRSRKMPAGALD